MGVGNTSAGRNLGINKDDFQQLELRYRKLYEAHGHSPAGVGWGVKDRQKERYEALTEFYGVEGKSVLDIGGGFGDAYSWLMEAGASSYTCVEAVDTLAEAGAEYYANRSNFTMVNQDFLVWEPRRLYDVTLVSGVFNFILTQESNLDFISSVLEKALGITREYLGANFLNSEVDYHEGDLFYLSPGDALAICRNLTNRYHARLDHFPYEFSVTLHPPQRIDRSTSTFRPNVAGDSRQGA